MAFERRYSKPVNKDTGVRFDQTVVLSGGYYQRTSYTEPLRRIGYLDRKTHQRLTFLTNNFALSPLTIAKLYRAGWQVELFFKWIKQHLRIQKFHGTSENAVKTQIWIALAICVLVAIVKKRLGLEASLYTILQFLSTGLFEKTPLNAALFDFEFPFKEEQTKKQLPLLAF